MNFIDEAVKELERCVTELGFPGVQIGSNVNQKNLSEPMFEPIWEKGKF
jgi:aminocarboxymuconate-semialdehyde decarboxylase